MGEHGPIPKRSTERRRRNKVAEDRVEVSPAAGVVEAPLTPAGLDPIAAVWFESLKVSGQAQFYEPSDWAAAIYVAHAMTKQLNAPQFGAQAFAAVWSAMSELLTTEGARRRARMEVERKAAAGTAASVSELDDYRKRVYGV